MKYNSSRSRVNKSKADNLIVFISIILTEISAYQRFSNISLRNIYIYALKNRTDQIVI